MTTYSYQDYLDSLESTNKPTAKVTKTYSYDDYLDNEKKTESFESRRTKADQKRFA